MRVRCACAADLQVLSAVVRHFTRGMAPVSMVCKAKTPAHAWGLTSSEVLSSMRRKGSLSLVGSFQCAAVIFDQPFGCHILTC